MRAKPRSAKMWGILVIILAFLSFIGGGGYVIGFLLALIGGILALVWRPPAMAQPAWGQPGAPAMPARPGMERAPSGGRSRRGREGVRLVRLAERCRRPVLRQVRRPDGDALGRVGNSFPGSNPFFRPPRRIGPGGAVNSTRSLNPSLPFHVPQTAPVLERGRH